MAANAIPFASATASTAAVTGDSNVGVIRVRLLTKFAAIAAAGAGAATVGGSMATAAAEDAPPSIVEDYAYPLADKILQEKGIKLVKGDGHILLVDCDAAGDIITVQSYTSATDFCFQVKGGTGYLALELERVYFVKSENRDLEATVSVAGEAGTATKDVPANEWVPFGEAANNGPATLLELRA